MQFLRQVLGVAGLVLWLAGAAIGAIPQPPTATTSEDFIAAQRAFNHATLLDEYRRCGARDPRWDAQAEAFLREAAEYWGGLSDARTVEFADRVTALGDAAMAAGCNDPLVTYAFARIGGDSSASQQLQPMYASRVQASSKAMVERGYHGFRCFSAASAALELLPRTNAAAAPRAELQQAMREQVVRAMTQVADPGGQRVLYSHLKTYVSNCDRDGLEAARAAIEAEVAAQPWLRDTVLGLIHIRLAWNARGSGWASTVDEAGWEGFSEHLELARERLTRAWETDPSRPEPAAEMITVAMGHSDSPALEMRTWFDRAIAAQFDYYPAYNDLIYGLLPRWHGSHEARYAFGLECAQTGRYDTDVPWRLIEVLIGSRKDNHNFTGNDGFELWRQLGAYPHVKRVLASYTSGGEAGVRWRQSIQLGFAWACGEWNDAAELVAALGEAWDPVAESKLGVSYEKVAFEVAGRRGRHAETIAGALASIHAGDLAKAIATLEGVPDWESAVLRRAVADRLQALRWRHAFDQGEPADLLSEGLVGWERRSGDWRAEDGAIVGFSEEELTRLVTLARFGNSWELSGRAEFDPRSTTTSRNFVLILGSVDRRTSPLCVRITPRDDDIDAGWIWRNGYTSFPGPIPDTAFSFRVRMREGVVDVWIDDRLIIDGHPLEDYDPDADNRPGIGIGSGKPGTIWAFRDLELRPARPGPARSHGGAPPAPR